MMSAADLPWWIVSPLVATLLCIHGSLQHEVIHHHPTRWRWLNDLIGWPPLSLWIPYPLYHSSHRLHHQVETLAEPGLDPESYYYWPDSWQHMHPLLRTLLSLNNSFAGRMIIGPWLIAGLYFVSEGKKLLSGDAAAWRAWAPHILLVFLLLNWLNSQGVSTWFYLLLCVWPGISLQLIRSYTEHRPVGDNNHQRTAITEGNWFTRLLFLNNNYHQVHHEFPGMPWYRIYPYYLANKASILDKNQDFYFDGYLQIIKLYLFRIKDHPVYSQPG